MSKTEVTQGVWESIMKTSPWKNKRQVKRGKDYPATYINWSMAKSFCKKSNLELPSESQWEYACRGGTITKYYWGNYFFNCCTLVRLLTVFTINLEYIGEKNN